MNGTIWRFRVQFYQPELWSASLWQQNKDLVVVCVSGGEEWISTGLYLSPGMKTYISLPEEIVNKGWQVECIKSYNFPLMLPPEMSAVPNPNPCHYLASFYSYSITYVFLRYRSAVRQTISTMQSWREHRVFMSDFLWPQTWCRCGTCGGDSSTCWPRPKHKWRA